MMTNAPSLTADALYAYDEGRVIDACARARRAIYDGVG